MAGPLRYLYFYTLIGLVGTTISPWMQFYLQASIVEKGVTVRRYPMARWDVIVGCVVASVIGDHHRGLRRDAPPGGLIELRSAADAAKALRPLAGEYASVLFAAGLFNASLFAATVLPISTAYAVCEGLGCESGLDKKLRTPNLLLAHTVLIVAGAGVLLIPGFPLTAIMEFSQVVNGILLPFVLISMSRLTNDRELMGQHVNSRAFNVIAWRPPWP